MKKIILLFAILLCTNSAQADIFSLDNSNNYGSFYSSNRSGRILDDLLFAERQLFNKVYRRDNIVERIERLELAVYGAIQNGTEAKRIKNIRKAVTNVASGGNGLQYFSNNMTGLTGNSNFGGNWNFGGNNKGFYSNSNWRNNYNCGFNNWGRGSRHYHSSHRLPPPCHGRHSHRLPPPCNHSHNNNPIVNGDYMQNYSLGTSVKILDD